MFNLELKPYLLKGESIAEASRVSGITYPTMYKMALGKWQKRTLWTLARFLFAAGFTSKTLADMKISDIFIIKDINNDARKEK